MCCAKKCEEASQPASQSVRQQAYCRWKELQRLRWALKGSRMDGLCEGNFVIRNVLHGLLQTFQGQYYIVMVHILSKKIEREAKSINGRQVEWKKWLLKRQPIPVKPTSVQKWVLLLIQGDERIKWYAGRKHFHQCRSERWSRLGEKWLIFLGSWLSMEILFA